MLIMFLELPGKRVWQGFFRVFVQAKQTVKPISSNLHNNSKLILLQPHVTQTEKSVQKTAAVP